MDNFHNLLRNENFENEMSGSDEHSDYLFESHNKTDLKADCTDR